MGAGGGVQAAGQAAVGKNAWMGAGRATVPQYLWATFPRRAGHLLSNPPNVPTLHPCCRRAAAQRCGARPVLRHRHHCAGAGGALPRCLWCGGSGGCGAGRTVRGQCRVSFPQQWLESVCCSLWGGVAGLCLGSSAPDGATERGATAGCVYFMPARQGRGILTCTRGTKLNSTNHSRRQLTVEQLPQHRSAPALACCAPAGATRSAMGSPTHASSWVIWTSWHQS